MFLFESGLTDACKLTVSEHVCLRKFQSGGFSYPGELRLAQAALGELTHGLRQFVQQSGVAV